jgi:hypothetical protein
VLPSLLPQPVAQATINRSGMARIWRACYIG